MRLSWIVRSSANPEKTPSWRPAAEVPPLLCEKQFWMITPRASLPSSWLPRMAMPDRGAPDTSKPSMVMKLHDESCTKSSVEPLVGALIFAPHRFRARNTIGAAAEPETMSHAMPAYVPSSTVTTSPGFTDPRACWMVRQGAPARPLAVSLPVGLTRYSVARAADGAAAQRSPPNATATAEQRVV